MTDESSTPGVPDLPDEEVLVRQAVAGDRAATGRLLLDHMDDLVAFLNRRIDLSTRQDDVQDVQQETLRLAWRDIDRFEYRGSGSFAAWLRQIAQHQLVDFYKRQKRKKRGGDHQQIKARRQSAEDSLLNVFDLVVMDDETPLRNVSRREAKTLLVVALSELPELQQQVIQLRYVDEKSYQEIGEIIDRTPQAVHGILKRAKQSLRDGLGRVSAYLSSK